MKSCKGKLDREGWICPVEITYRVHESGVIEIMEVCQDAPGVMAANITAELTVRTYLQLIHEIKRVEWFKEREAGATIGYRYRNKL